ncbi:MAG: M1 family metallopeptidase, partial [Armatimonadetes bacterium]|nr:M1 family metallopeptidase [Armatimonadota bacterium]
MKRPGSASLRPLYVVAVVCALLLGVAAASRRQDDSAARTKLAAEFQKAVNSGDNLRAASLTANGVQNDYEWIREWRVGGNPRTWRAGIVPLRGVGRRTLLHVSRAQVCQSTSDHLYELAGPPSRPEIGREIPETELVGARVTGHRLTVSLDHAARTVRVTDRAQFTRISDEWPVCLFRLNEYFRVSEARLDAQPTPFQQAGGFVIVPKPAGAQATLTLQYEATLPKVGETYIAADEAALTAYWYAHTARLPATSDIEMSTPDDWHSIAPGVPLAETTAGGRRTTRWRNTIPVCYLTAAAGRYTRTTRQAGSTQVSAWLRRHSDRRAKEILDETEGAIRFFTGKFGSFPYNRYAVVESLIFPPGLEAYSFTLVGSSLLPSVIVHEVSHTWWGGLVPNTYTRSMWNEALATYSESLYRRLSPSRTNGRPGEGAREAAAGIPLHIPLERVTDAMHPTHSAVGYGFGSLVLEQLERMVGTTRMLEKLSAFVERHPRGDAADWSELVSAVASVCGPEWRAAVDGWLSTTRLPSYRLSQVRTRSVPDGFETTGLVAPDAPGLWAQVAVVVETQGGAAESPVLVRSGATPFS